MANDIYNRKTDVSGGSFSADQTWLTFPRAQGEDGGSAGLLVQNLQISYQQQVTRLFEIGTPAIYHVGGRTDGQIQIQRIVGPAALQKAFYEQYGDICKVRQNSLSFSFGSSCGDSATAGDNPEVSVEYNANMCIITNLSVAVNVQSMLINESMSIQTSNLQYDITGSGPLVQ